MSNSQSISWVRCGERAALVLALTAAVLLVVSLDLFLFAAVGIAPMGLMAVAGFVFATSIISLALTFVAIIAVETWEAFVR